MLVWDPSAHNQKLINNVLNMSIMISFFGSLQFIANAAQVLEKGGGILRVQSDLRHTCVVVVLYVILIQELTRR